MGKIIFFIPSKGKKLISHLIEEVIEKCLRKAKDRIINACSELIQEQMQIDCDVHLGYF